MKAINFKTPCNSVRIRGEQTELIMRANHGKTPNNTENEGNKL